MESPAKTANKTISGRPVAGRPAAAHPNCQNFIASTVKNGPGKIVGLVMTFILSYVMHRLLKPLSQPRITSDIIIGIVICNIPWVEDSMDERFLRTINFAAEFGMICYMFVLGLEMDPCTIFRPPSQDVIMAYAGMVSTLILACSITPFLYYASRQGDIGFTLTLSITLSGSSSHILTRIITNLKIGKSGIGKLVIAAGVHSDMVSMLLLSIGYVFHPETGRLSDVPARLPTIITMGAALLIQTVFAAKVSPIFMNWVNNENPEGKPMKGSHLVLSIAFMVLVCTTPTFYGFHPILSAFVAGIFLPNEGRVSKWAVGKINYLLSTIFFPLFFFWMGIHTDFREFEFFSFGTWVRLFVVLLIGLCGKIVGTVICGAMLGFHWRESAELGFLINTKGHFHIFVACIAKTSGRTSPTTATIFIMGIFLSVVYTPSVVLQIIKRARKRAPTHRRSLQALDATNELRVLLCLQGPQNVPSTINFIEITRGSADPGILVYATDMVELTDQIAATLVQSEGIDTVTVTDKEVTNMRDQITSEIQAYAEENGDGISVRRMLALSSFSGMPQDICILAEDLMVSLIILPFHKNQKADKSFDGGNPGFRYVNRKVLRTAPCSVGILVDRGFGSVEKISTSARTLQVAVLFIGGKDDREAVAYAGRVARHPGVKLTIIRFLLDDNPENASRRAGGFRVNVAEQEAEMKLDDECFAQFYERHVAGGHVAYAEKHVANSAETYSTLRSLEGQYALIIVGRAGRVNSILTVGMNDWQQCPELGPIGDVLSGSTFSQNTSVLVIQQHGLKGDLNGIEDDFTVM